MPTHWKQAKVCPIYKSGDRSECNNYRPISVLCGVSKIVERRHVHDALYTYLTERNLLFTAQSGFRPGHSCETALFRMMDMWAGAMDRGEVNGVIMLDLRKAFDLISHECLLQKNCVFISAMITQASGFYHTSQAEPNKHQSKVISPRQQSSQRASLKAQSWARYSSFYT